MTELRGPTKNLTTVRGAGPKISHALLKERPVSSRKGTPGWFPYCSLGVLFLGNPFLDRLSREDRKSVWWPIVRRICMPAKSNPAVVIDEALETKRRKTVHGVLGLFGVIC